MEEPSKTISSPTPLLLLPLELRNIIYELLIQDAQVHDCSPLLGLLDWQLPPFPRAHKFDLEINTERASIRNLCHPSNLISTCRQIHDEFFTVIYSRIHHLQLSGDFLLDLASKDAVFELLGRRPWVTNTTRTIKISLQWSKILPLVAGMAVRCPLLLEQHPWLSDRVRIAHLTVRSLEVERCPVWWQRMRELWLDRFRTWIGWRVDRKEIEDESQEYNSVPALATLFETFPLLEKIDIMTDSLHLLSVFPSLEDTTESVRTLSASSLEVNVWASNWKVLSFYNMLYRNGLEKGTIQFGGQCGGAAKVDISYETLVAGAMVPNRVVRYRLWFVVSPERSFSEAPESDAYDY